MGERFPRRSAGRWTLTGAVAGGLAASLLYVGLVLDRTESTAAILLIWTPIVFVAAAPAAAAWGWSLHRVRCTPPPWRRGGAGRSLPWLAAAVFLAGSAALFGWHALRIGAFYSYRSAGMRPAALERGYRGALAAGDYLQLAAIAANPNTPPGVLLALARSDDPLLHERRRGWSNLFDRDALAVARRLLRNPSLPPEAIPALAASTSAYVLGDLAAHRLTPEPILRDIDRRSDSYLVHWGLAGNARTPPEILESIAAASDLASDWVVASGLAGNPGTPLPVLAELADHRNPNVRWRLAGNPAIDAGLMERLREDPDRSVRVRLTQNEAVGYELLQAIGEDPDEDVREYARRGIARVARDPATPRDLLARLAADPDPAVRREACLSPALDRPLMERLAADPEANVRYYLAANPALAVDLLERLARDDSASVRAVAAARLEERAAPGRPDPP